MIRLPLAAACAWAPRNAPRAGMPPNRAGLRVSAVCRAEMVMIAPKVARTMCPMNCSSNILRNAGRGGGIRTIGTRFPLCAWPSTNKIIWLSETTAIVVMYGVLPSYSGDGTEKLAARLAERKTEVGHSWRSGPDFVGSLADP
jgi:hypothetical protein